METKKNFITYTIPKLFIILTILICGPTFSCKKYLDIKRTSTQSLIETAKDCQLYLNDYERMNKGYPSDGEMSAGDFFVNDAGFLSATVSAEDQAFYTWQAAAIRSSSNPQYVNAYQVVYRSNLVLEATELINDGSSKAVIDDLRGQAYFFRAYSFWNIAQLYAPPYNEALASKELGISLRLNSDINNKSRRGTLKETYDQITGDLNIAISLLSTTSEVPSRPNKVAAYAMLSRVYLSMQNYPAALQNASLALGLKSQLLDFNTLSTTANNPFLRFNKEVIFHSVMTSSSMLVPGSASSNIAKINLDLVNSYDNNDLRKVIYYKPNSGSNVGTFRFTGNYEPVTSAALFSGLAVDEMYLIRAECFARAGNQTSALADLNGLLKTRYKSGTFVNVSVATAEESLKIILSERRKELIMRGQRWSDLRRLNNDPLFSVILTRTAQGNTYTLPPNDLRYTLLLPNDVITNSNMPQNPR